MSRYSRQTRFAPLGEEGQKRLAASRVTLIGCGALGTHLADTLGRAGIGFLRICDRDFVELDNLPRQVLFDESDARDRTPKAAAAADKLRRINSDLEIDARIVDVAPSNIESLIADADLVLDGTDNFETRFLINDACVKRAKPWVYGGCVGSYGQVLAILPGTTACLACWLEELPAPGSSPTCDTAGVIGPAVAAVAALQAAEAMKILSGHSDKVFRGTHTVDVWNGVHQRIGAARNPECRACVGMKFEHLSALRTGAAVALCGRDAVQVTPAGSGGLDLADLERRLAPAGKTTRNAFLLRFEAEGCELTIFPDARVIVKGTADETRARALYARYIGA